MAKKTTMVIALRLTLACAVLLLLGGCLLTRLMAIKEQLCNFDQNFRVEYGEGIRIVLLQPVLLDRDITWLAGVQPTVSIRSGDTLLMHYEVGKKGSGDDRSDDISIELGFVYSDGHYRLQHAGLNANLTRLLTPEMIVLFVDSVCKAPKSIVNRQISVDIGEIDPELLPTRSEVLNILGPPNRRHATPGVLAYDYGLRQSFAPVAAIDIHYADAYIPVKMDVTYLRYRLRVDLQKRRALLKILGDLSTL